MLTRHVLVAFAAMVGTATSVIAADMPSRTVEVSVPGKAIGAVATAPVKFRYPLSKFVATAGPLLLKDASNEARIALPMSARLKPTNLQVTLVVTNSIALMAAKSALTVRVNDATLAQIRLDPNSPTATVKINVPVDLLRPGFNNLALAVTQHTDDDCEDPEAPELWTEIDTAQSSLDLTAEYRDGPFRVSDFDKFFAPGIGGARSLTIVTAGAGTDAQSLQAGSFVAQAAALRAQYEPVAFNRQSLTDEGWKLDDHALVGTAADLAAVLGKEEADKITGPYVSFTALDKRQAQLVVSGKTAQEVVTAARSLAAMDIPLIDGANTTIGEIKDDPATNAGRLLAADRVYTFADLGLPTTTARGAGITNLNLDLPFAPNFYAPEQANVDLLLDLSYGAGFGTGSVLNVEVNGKFVRGILLGNDNGDGFRGYRIPVPLRDFVGGRNRITFAVHMRSQRKDKCAGVSGRYLEMTVYGSSAIKLPPAANMTVQPDLDLFVRTGYPYIGGGKAAEVWAAQPELIGSAWTVAARVAQSAGQSLNEVTYRVGGEAPKGPSLQIADTKALTPAVFAGTMEEVAAVKRVPYGTFRVLPGQEAPGILANMFGVQASTEQAKVSPVKGYVKQSGELGRNAVMLAMQSQTGNGTTTVVTADTPALLVTSIERLIAPEYWSRAQGDFLMWQDTPESVLTFRLAPRFAIGDGEHTMLTLRLYVSQHPWLWLGGTALLLMVLSGLTVRILTQRARAARDR